MQTSNVDPHSIVKTKKSWLLSINGKKIAKFFYEAYLGAYDDKSSKDQNSNMKLQNTENHPSVGRKVN